MADGDDLRARRRASRASRTQRFAMRHAAEQARRELDFARREGDRERVTSAERELRRRLDRDGELERDLEEHRAAIAALRDRVLDDDAVELPPLQAAIPIALLPVRLETHFARVRSRITELRIRIYPDDLHVDSHEEELTDREVADARRYWGRVWRAGPSVDHVNVAWRELARHHGGERAAYVVERMRPTNEAPELTAPIPAEGALPAEPVFPEPARKAGDWTRAPKARGLPDRWVAIGFRDGERAFVRHGSLIPEDLAVGPDPTAERTEEQLFVDDGSRWTVDFDEAEAVGMGIRVGATGGELDAGLDLLLVLGVKGSAAPDESAEELADLLVSQRHTEGLEFIRPGTPTNNTEVERSGWGDHSAPPPGSGAPAANTITPGDRSVAGRWATALGLDAAQTVRAFGTVEGAMRNDDEEAHAMVAALWPATFGYLLEHLAGPQVRPHIVALRDHALHWLRPGGVHQSVRVGQQPYGLIVHTDLDRVTLPRNRTEQALLRLLVRLRDEFWIPAIERVPRVGRTGDPDSDLVEILGLQASSPRFAVRPVAGPAFVANLQALFETPQGPAWSDHQAAANSTLASLDLAINAEIAELTHFPQVSVDVPELVQEGPVMPGQTLEPNYIEWVRTSGHRRIWREEHPAEPPATLLYRLLRHSALQETARESVNQLLPHHPDLATARLEPELIDLRAESTETPTTPSAVSLTGEPTLARLLELPITGVTDGVAIGEYLTGKRDSDDPALAQFRDFWDALAVLESLPVERLELLLRQTLDTAAHRLDAWLSSFSARLLATRRADERSALGVHLGGYGWVEDVRPRTDQRSDGFVHAPSVRHAGLAAVLRSAYLSHRDTSGGEAFAVDLSSERVRLATWLLDGVRGGQSLGALLGYRFERALHEGHPGVELDVFIFALRRRAPLVAEKMEPTGEALEATAARNVVDGLALLRRWERGGIDFDDDDLPDSGTQEHDAVIDELESLRSLLDSVGDALLAESIFQLGNPSRTAATLDAVASGEIAPPELEFARSPRHGLGIVHRLVVAFPASAPTPSGWTPDAEQIRADVDPMLNSWVGSVLGAASRYRYVVRYLEPNDTLRHEEIRTIAGLGLSPLDAIHLAETDGQGGHGELAERARHEATGNPPPQAGSGAQVEIVLDVPNDPFTVSDLFEIARALRVSMQRVRPLDGTHLAALGEEAEHGFDVAELQVRSNTAVARFLARAAALDAFIAQSDTAALSEAVDALIGVHQFGVRGAVPQATPADASAARDILLRQARAVAKQVASRLLLLEEEDDGFDPTAADDVAQVAHLRARVAAITGDSLPVLPRFVAATSAELAQSLGEQETLTGGDRAAPVTWLQQNARVRWPVADLNDALLYDGALNGRDPYPLIVAQLPFRSAARWAALSHAPEPEVDGNRLSLVLCAPFGIEPAGPLGGFIVDEWSETVPGNEEATAVTFHYDQPGARAPNAIVLAVAPDRDAVWDLATLERIALDTLRLGKLRAVDGDTLRGLGQFLPALYFATNSAGDTIDIGFDRLISTATMREDI